MFFLSDYSSVEFGRKIGSKDKKKRITIGGGALTGLKYGAAIGGAASLAKVGSHFAVNPEFRQLVKQKPIISAVVIGLGAGINAIGHGIIGAGIGAGINAIRKRDQNRNKNFNNINNIIEFGRVKGYR